MNFKTIKEIKTQQEATAGPIAAAAGRTQHQFCDNEMEFFTLNRTQERLARLSLQQHK